MGYEDVVSHYRHTHTHTRQSESDKLQSVFWIRVRTSTIRTLVFLRPLDYSIDHFVMRCKVSDTMVRCNNVLWIATVAIGINWVEMEWHTNVYGCKRQALILLSQAKRVQKALYPDRSFKLHNPKEYSFFPKIFLPYPRGSKPTSPAMVPSSATGDSNMGNQPACDMMKYK